MKMSIGVQTSQSNAEGVTKPQSDTSECLPAHESYQKWAVCPGSPERLYRAQLREKTQKIRMQYWNFSEELINSFVQRESIEHHLFKRLSNAAQSLFDFEDDLIESFKCSIEMLLREIAKKQSYVNFDMLTAIVERHGTSKDKEEATKYQEAFKLYAKGRIFDIDAEVLGRELEEYEKVMFVLDEGQSFRLIDFEDFKVMLSKLLGIKSHEIALHCIKKGSVLIVIQVPTKRIKNFETIPLFEHKIFTLKQWRAQSFTLKNETFELSYWDILKSLDLRTSTIGHTNKAKILSAVVNGEKCLAINYTEHFSDEGNADTNYVKYLNNFFKGKHKNLPEVKGLYYNPSSEEGMHSYPIIVVEHLVTLKQLVPKLAISQATQISLLFDVASSLASFEEHDSGGQVSVFPDSILVQEDAGSDNISARFCPLYGYSYCYESEVRSSCTPLSIDKLKWMSDVVKIIENREEIPETNILKRLFDQKWISLEEYARPKSFKILSEELQRLFEKERIYMDLLLQHEDNENLEEEVQIHFILIGHTGVGKTSLRKHLKNEPINKDESPTIVMEPELLYRESIEMADSDPFKKIRASLSTSSSKIFLTMWDTGGQPIFQDLLPCFARLKCMYGIVFRLPDLHNFDDVRPNIRPCNHQSESIVSPFTNKDILYRNLAYVQAFSCSLQDRMIPQVILKPESTTINPAAVVVGTCKDVIDNLSAVEENKQKLNKEISNFAEEYHVSVYSVFDDKNSYIHEVDNTLSGKKVDHGINYLRKNISQCAQQSNSKIPKEWKLFEAKLQRLSYTSHINHGIITLTDAIEIGKKCLVSNPEAALMYFHELGTFMWYHLSKRESIKNYVVIDPKLLLEVLGQLFFFDSISLSPDEQLRIRKGVITIETFKTLLKHKVSRIDDSWFIEFLEEHQLIIKVTFSELKSCYFLPSLLPIKPNYVENLKNFVSADHIAPIYVVPQTGYIATGLFPRLLTALAGVTYGNSTWKISAGEGCCGAVCRNQYEFVVNGSIQVVLTEFSKKIRIDCIPCRNAIVEDDLYSFILSTVDVQLQRIVPQWTKQREFDLTFMCPHDQCMECEEHFLLPIDPLQSNWEVKCTKGKRNSLILAQKRWFTKEVITESDIFKKSLEKGSLNISMASVIVTGLNECDCINAKHVIFQEPVTSMPVQAQTHDVYFRPEGHSELKKFYMDKFDEVILYTAEDDLSRQYPAVTEEVPLQSKTTLLEVPSPPMESTKHSAIKISEKAISSKIKQSDFDESHSEEAEGIGDYDASEESDSEEISETNHAELSNFDYIMRYMSKYKNKGKVEIFHAFYCESDQCVQEVVNIFIRNVTLIVLVSNSSTFNTSKEIDLLKKMSSLAQKGIIVNSSSTVVQNEMSLLQFSSFLISEVEKNILFSINCKHPQSVDYEKGISIINHASSTAITKTFPFSWYLLGFKLHSFMISQNIIAVSISKHAMVVAKRLNIDKPTVLAALEHLTDNNVILYFGEALSDTVFIGVEPFAKIFLELWKNYYQGSNRVINQSDLYHTIERHTRDIVPVENLCQLFGKLMIIAPYNGSYLIPCFLSLLNEQERKDVCGKSTEVTPLLIKCPSSGYEFMSMLTVYLLTLPNRHWKVLETSPGTPACLHKNCVKFMLQKNTSKWNVTISFTMEGYIEIHQNSEDVSIFVVKSILKGLEKIKLVLRSYQSFNFCASLMFQCKCDENFHTAVYDQYLGKLICKKGTSTSLTDLQRSWLISDNHSYKEHITVNNVVEALSTIANRWLRVSEMLEVPTFVTDTLLVLRLSDKNSLRRVVEWWFKNTNNPEWSVIEKIISNLYQLRADEKAEWLSTSYSVNLKEGYAIRNYQRELAQPGIEGKNYIMIAPTGSGKTVVAALVISDHLNKRQLQLPCHVVFITETKPLAEQRKTALNSLIPEALVEVSTGDTLTMIADSIRLNNNISVCTAGKLLNEIQAKKVTFDQLSLMVVDECHHTNTKGHPFTKLMEMYLQYRDDSERIEKLPQVIGMTASPGAGDNPDLDRTKIIDHLLLLAARMDATGGFKTVTENIDELQERTKSCNFLNPRDVKNDQFLHVVSAEMDRLEKLISNNLMKNNFQKWSQEYEAKVQQVKSSLELTGDSQVRDYISTLTLLCCYSNALTLYMDMEQKDAMKVMKEHNGLPSDYSKYTPREEDLRHGLDFVLWEAERIVPKRNPLLTTVEETLLSTFESNLASRGIIFVPTKRHAHAMLEWVVENKAFKGMLRPIVITGNTHDGRHSMTQVMQEKEVMSSFYAGETNLLIATSVVEEGLDIPECNFLIRYKYGVNKIPRVMIQGRERVENSRGYLLVSSSRKKYQEFKNQELVDEILEKKWLPTGDHLSERLVELQRSIIDAVKLKSHLQKQKKLTHKSDEVRLLCRKCKVFGCYGSDIYTITDESNTAFHYVVPSEEFSKRYSTKVHHTPADLILHQVKKTHKICCLTCDFDWGVKCIWPKEGHSFPVIKCRAFVFVIGEHLRTLTKWKEAPFKIQSLSKWLSKDNNSSDEF